MNKRPVFLRLLFAVIVLAVFTVSMYPLQQRDFYDTLHGLLEQKNDPKIEQLIAWPNRNRLKIKTCLLRRPLNSPPWKWAWNCGSI